MMKHGERVVGSAAVETYGEPGRLLTGKALQVTRERGICRMYLLTGTAGDCFRSLGFELVGRQEVPAEVRRSMQSVSACPESALTIVRDLDGERE